MKISLPIPPSVNALYRNVPNIGRVRTSAYNSWVKQADKHFLLQKRSLTPVTGHYAMKISLPKMIRGDVSNRIKAAEDYCVSRGLTADDSQSQSLTIERVDGLAPGMFEIEAWEV